jgi:hypothetical protein
MGQEGRSSGRIQLLLALGLLVVLVAFIVLRGEEEAPRPFDPVSAAPTGLRALWLWLEAMAFTVERNDGAAFSIPDECAVIFVFPNQQAYTAAEAEQLHQWVTAGGTLVLIGASPLEEALSDTFQVEVGPSVAGMVADTAQRQPLVPDLAGPIRLSSNAATLDLSQAPAAIPVLATAAGQITLAHQPWQQGRIWHLSLHHSLINEQLRDPAQATLVPALLRHAPSGSRILFDTYHLFGPTVTAGSGIRSLQEWLYRMPPGWAVLFALAVTLLFLLLQGRRLGPPLPAREELRRREAAEYVTAMANLLRRGQQRAFVAAHHKRRLKRALGRALNLSADSDDATFLRQVQQVDEWLSPEELQQLTGILQTLGSTANEHDLIKAVNQVDDLLTRHRRGTTVK